MPFTLQRRPLIVLLTCLHSLFFGTVHAFSFPTPGLYKMGDIRWTSDTIEDGRIVRSEQTHGEGETGSETTRYSRPGKAPVTRHFPGEGPATTCIPEQSPNAVGFFPDPACIGKDAVTTGAVTTFGLSCPTHQFKGSVRQLDSKTWEYELFVTESGPMSDSAGSRGFERMLEHTAKTAPTPSERKEAAEALRELREARAEEAREEAKASVDDGFPEQEANNVRKLRVVYQLIRIADNCPSARKK